MGGPSALRSCTHNDDPRRQVPGDDARLSNQLNRRPAKTFADLPVELREMIWAYALPEARVFSALVYASKRERRMRLIERNHLHMPLAHVCFESRQLVKKAGYELRFRDEDEPDDPGVWFHPRRDVVEQMIWSPCEFWGWK
ncbi:hypothetical protein F4814DRAFT_414901 [Daldinia grandis]|nr:hypothetical protein F4814DRAFT_414901 [Daldinia grandis]